MSVGHFLYRNSSGNTVQGDISLHDYEIAARLGVSTKAVINAKYPDADPQFGTAWQQGLRSAGIFPKGEPKFGIPSTTIQDAMSGECMNQSGILQLAGNTISSPSIPVGSSTPASRLFLPEVILGLIESNLQEDWGMEQGMFERMIADDLAIAGPVYTQPTIDITAPRDFDARAIAQNALPRNLASITASQWSKTVSTQAVGLQISDQATQLASLNLVQIILSQQMFGAKLRMLWNNLSNVVNGNLDAGESALTPVGFKATYDSTAAATTITHKGWIKALYQPDRQVRFDSMICDIDSYLAVQNRTGRPLMFDPATSGANHGNAGTYGLDVTMTAPANFAALQVPFVMLVPTGSPLAANQILLFDSRYALRRVTNTLAAYSAVESMVLQRTTMYRADFGFLIHRLFSDAFLLIDFTNG